MKNIRSHTYYLKDKNKFDKAYTSVYNTKENLENVFISYFKKKIIQYHSQEMLKVMHKLRGNEIKINNAEDVEYKLDNVGKVSENTHCWLSMIGFKPKFASFDNSKSLNKEPTSITQDVSEKLTNQSNRRKAEETQSFSPCKKLKNDNDEFKPNPSRQPPIANENVYHKDSTEKIPKQAFCNYNQYNSTSNLFPSLPNKGFYSGNSSVNKIDSQKNNRYHTNSLVSQTNNFPNKNSPNKHVPKKGSPNKHGQKGRPHNMNKNQGNSRSNNQTNNRNINQGNKKSKNRNNRSRNKNSCNSANNANYSDISNTKPSLQPVTTSLLRPSYMTNKI